jgi:hypothetical protein
LRSSALVCLPGTPDLDTLLVAPMITGITFIFEFQNQSMKLCAQYFSASFFKLFLSEGTERTIIINIIHYHHRRC